MVKNRLLLVSVAFCVSFVLSLFVNRGIKIALTTGLITVVATTCGIVVANRKQLIQQKLTLSALEHQIRQLEKWEIELNESVAAIAAAEERAEDHLDDLQKELNQLYIQTDAQKRYKQHLNQELIALTKQSQKMEAEVQHQLSSIHLLEQQREELDVTVRSLKAEKHKVETGLKLVQTQFQQFQEQITTQENQKKELEQDLSLLKRIKPQLETELFNLRTHLHELETSKSQLNDSLAAIIAERQATEANLNSLQAQLGELQAQVLEQRNQEQQESRISQNQVRQTQEEEQRQSENLNNKWTEFGSRLSHAELRVLKAIAQQDNPNAVIKKIAEEIITMPEVLIAAINEHALATIGDIIIEPESVAPIIAEAEYLTNVHKILRINKTN